MSWNEMEGPLPTDIATVLPKLRDLEIHSNKWTGTLPPEYFQHPNLLHLNVGDSQ